MPLALLGVVACWPARRRLALPLGFAITQVIGVSLFLVSSRYRAPSLPVWALFACAGAAWLAGALRAGPWGRRVGLLLVLAAALVAFNRETRESRLDLRGEEAFYRAQGAFESGRKLEARAQLDRTLELEPRNNDAWKLRGLLQSEAGDPNGALASWRRAIEIDPLDVDAGRRIAFELEKRGDVDGALAALQANLEHVGDPRAYANDYSEDMLRMAQLYLRRGDRDRARASARAAAEFNPDNAAAIRLRGELERSRDSGQP
jgi:tetratricopeptide (TPR) repeat protein